MKIFRSRLREIKATYKTVNDVNNACIQSSKDVANYFRRIFPVELNEREAMIVLYLNNSNTTVGFSTAGIGGITSTAVDVRLILRDALLTGSTSIILCHNHPSQSLKPSQADLNLTKKVKKAGQVMDIKVLDHLILTEDSYYSFADEGKL
jgi:DNA repair protein RadC